MIVMNVFILFVDMGHNLIVHVDRVIGELEELHELQVLMDREKHLGKIIEKEQKFCQYGLQTRLHRQIQDDGLRDEIQKGEKVSTMEH